MKPASFAYHLPDTVDEALALLAEHGWDAKVLAGGQSLVPAMNFRLARPAVLVDLNGIASLAWIDEPRGGGIRIGAMTRHRAVERHVSVAERAPLLAEALPWIAHAQIRNRGTVGGSLAHADPASELPAVMLALDASFVVRSAAATRRIPAAEFFTGLFATALEPGEILVEVDVPPAPSRSGDAFEELARRPGDFALVGVATRVMLDDAGQCADARIALLSVGDGPVQAVQAVAALAGRAPDAAAIDVAAQAAAEEDIDPAGDLHASPDYKRHLTRILVRRALTRAVAAARAGA